MELTVKRVGNSAALPLSKPLLNILKAQIGSKLEVVVSSGSIIISPARETFDFTLEDILATCTPAKIALNDEDKTWLSDSPTGNEID